MGPREKSRFQPKLFAAQRALHGFFHYAKNAGRDWRQSHTAPSRIIRTIGVIVAALTAIAIWEPTPP
jgi:hypothetical protein